MEERGKLSAGWRQPTTAALTAAVMVVPSLAFASVYGAGTYGADLYTVGEVVLLGPTATPEASVSSRSSGTTVQGQVKNLLDMGKVDQANALMQQYPNLFPATSSTAAGLRYIFTRSLQYLDRGEDVRQLQIYLNTNGTRLAAEGPGSPGQETDFFGALTYRALIRFQEIHAEEILRPLGLAKGTGLFGPATRAFVASVAMGADGVR